MHGKGQNALISLHQLVVHHRHILTTCNYSGLGEPAARKGLQPCGATKRRRFVAKMVKKFTPKTTSFWGLENKCLISSTVFNLPRVFWSRSSEALSLSPRQSSFAFSPSSP